MNQAIFKTKTDFVNGVFFQKRLLAVFWFAATLAIAAGLGLFSEPAASEEISLPGLKAPVQVFFDTHGIPYIEAQNDDDLFFVQGYIHARDRFWQMEKSRMSGMGRMAELFGKGSLNGDLERRQLRFPEICSQIIESIPESSRGWAQAYANGVNAWMERAWSGGSPPFPFDRLEFYEGYKPEPWKPEHSVCIFRTLGWALSGFGSAEKEFDKLIPLVGKKRFDALLPNGSAAGVNTLQDKGARLAVPDKKSKEKKSSWVPGPLPVGAGGLEIGDLPFPNYASNNWVVSGSRAAAGNAMLANDTHMGVGNPPEWHLVSFKSPGFKAVGLSIPGAPLIAIGHNEHYAWGATVAAFDVVDTYKDRKVMGEEGRYLFKGEKLDVEKKEVVLKYNEDGKLKEKSYTILYTVHGLVIEETPTHYYAMRWTGLEPTDDYEFAKKAIQGKTLDDFKDALDHYGIGAQNFVYADREGNIYYRATGQVPIRRGEPWLPMDGSSGKYEWQGTVPPEELPHLENPASGFIATANNINAPADTDHYFARFYAAGMRAARITELLQANDSVTFEQMMEYQSDVKDYGARIAKRYLTADGVFALLPEDLKPYAQMVRDWDERMEKDLVAPSIYTKWLAYFGRAMLKDDLPEEALRHILREESLFWLFRLDGEGDSDYDWWDDRSTPDKKETSDDLAAASLADAIDELKEVAGADPRGWRWGDIHKLEARFLWPGGQKAERPPSYGPIPWRGNAGTLDVGESSFIGKTYPVHKIPLCRFVAEMAPDGIRAVNIIPGGQSQDPSSPHYDDMFYDWAAHMAYPVYLVDRFEGKKESVITFTP